MFMGNWPPAFSKIAARNGRTPKEQAEITLADLKKRLEPPYSGFNTPEQTAQIKEQIEKFEQMIKENDKFHAARLVEEETGVNPITEQIKLRQQNAQKNRQLGLLAAALTAAGLFFFA